MNDADVITDLKQFISTELARQLLNFTTKDDFDRLEQKVDGLEQKINVIQSTIDESVFGYIGEVDDQVQKHEKRIRKLERKAA